MKIKIKIVIYLLHVHHQFFVHRIFNLLINILVYNSDICLLYYVENERRLKLKIIKKQRFEGKPRNHVNL